MDETVVLTAMTGDETPSSFFSSLIFLIARAHDFFRFFGGEQQAVGEDIGRDVVCPERIKDFEYSRIGKRLASGKGDRPHPGGRDCGDDGFPLRNRELFPVPDAAVPETRRPDVAGLAARRTIIGQFNRQPAGRRGRAGDPVGEPASFIPDGVAYPGKGVHRVCELQRFFLCPGRIVIAEAGYKTNKIAF